MLCAVNPANNETLNIGSGSDGICKYSSLIFCFVFNILFTTLPKKWTYGILEWSACGL